MKNRFLLTVLFILTSILSFAQNPHFTRDYSGIPVISGNGDWHLLGTGLEVHYDSMHTMGVSYFWSHITNIAPQMGVLGNKFKIIPINVKSGVTNYNYIAYYCDAKYSVWEAEGTDTIVGKATLERSSLSTDKVFGPSETYIRTKPFTPDTTILWGPYYAQEVNYTVKGDSSDTLFYNAEYRLKLERNELHQDTTISDNLTEEICKILVTQSRIKNFVIDSVITIASMILYRSDFQVLNQFYEKILTYDLSIGFPVTDNLNMPRFTAIANSDSLCRFLRENIEFKVEWLGNPKYLLSVDKVTVSDIRGERLKTSNIPRTLIESQLNQLLPTYNTFVVGWHGIDEPFSIDNFEPIKIVAQILKDRNQQLYLPFMGFYFGVWENPNNPFGTNHLSPHNEFFKRTNGLVNIWQNMYMYDQPFKDTSTIDTEYWGIGGYKDVNIKIAANNYALAYSIDSLFGVSLQTSAQKNPQSDIRDPLPHEVLYNANLALLHGARFFDLYTYWQQSDSASGYTFTGMVNAGLVYTQKWEMWRDVLKPRLNGLFGNTLKRLKPEFAEYRLGFNPSANYDLNINRIKRVKLGNGQVPEALGTFADIGFFKLNGEEGNNYFMLLTRHYTDPNINNYNIEFRDLLNFKNWRLKNYIDGNDVTVVPNTPGYAESPSFTLSCGDAILFSLHPVVNYGGKLITSETAGNGMTLYDAMTIESGATLTVNGTYNINANIEVKDGGQLQIQSGANLVFNNGAKLIVNGGLTAVGTSANKITFDFTSQQSGNGINTEDEDFLTMTNCIIKNAVNGLSIIHRTRGTALIRYNKFENCLTGISLVNATSALIQGNEFINTQYAIFTSNVSGLNIISNQITGNNSNFPGLILNSSSGFVRKNSISGHFYGILFGNTVANLGTNSIFNNSNHGLHVGPGSQPNLKAQWIRVPCISVPIYSPFVGVNNIYNNGGNTNNQYDDGAEIYLENSSILLDGGCNTIADDRLEMRPPYNTLNLICGEQEEQLNAANNHWGYHSVYSLEERFCSLPVMYEPEGCIMPDNAIECEVIAYTTDGIAIDTFHTVYAAPDEQDEMKELFAEASALFEAGDYTQASQLYYQIITDYSSQKESFEAFSKLLVIERLRNSQPQAYEVLKNLYLASLNNITDTLMIKMIIQLANLCLVNGGKLTEAFDAFQNIIDNNPGTEEADFAEIDLYTTALLDTSIVLNKGGFEKVTASSFNEKLNNLLSKKFGNPNTKSEEKIIPKEYSLYQNYPNPFNPTTTIKYDLPKDGIVELEIYDILGRRITKLVSEFKPAGSYEQRFDASGLASGIYIYQLKSGEFISSKKMLMVK